MKRHITEDGFPVKLDNQDYDKVQRFMWRVLVVDGKQVPASIINERTILMRDFVSGGLATAKNGDEFDLQSANLTTQAKETKKMVVGVIRAGDQHRAKVTVMGEVHLGELRNSELEAAQDYDVLAQSFFGDDAKTNKKLGVL